MSSTLLSAPTSDMKCPDWSTIITAVSESNCCSWSDSAYDIRQGSGHRYRWKCDPRTFITVQWYFLSSSFHRLSSGLTTGPK